VIDSMETLMQGMGSKLWNNISRVPQRKWNGLWESPMHGARRSPAVSAELEGAANSPLRTKEQKTEHHSRVMTNGWLDTVNHFHTTL
jgi:Rieske Fe-S protein